MRGLIVKSQIKHCTQIFGQEKDCLSIVFKAYIGDIQLVTFGENAHVVGFNSEEAKKLYDACLSMREHKVEIDEYLTIKVTPDGVMFSCSYPNIMSFSAPLECCVDAFENIVYFFEAEEKRKTIVDKLEKLDTYKLILVDEYIEDLQRRKMINLK